MILRLIHSSRPIIWLAAFGVMFAAAHPAFAQKKQPKKQPKKKAADGDEPVRLPKLEELKLPTVEELLDREAEGNRQDWVIIRGPEDIDKCDVMITLPVSPRPKTVEKIEKRVAKKWPQPRTEEERLDQIEKRRKLPFLYVNLVDGGKDPLRRIHHAAIREIRHHEDLLLLRIEKLQEEGNLPLAYELLFNMKRQKPNWPRLDVVENKQLFAEAARHAKRNEQSAALVRLEELHNRDSNFDGLLKLMGDVVDKLTAASVKKNDYRRARHYLGRLYRRDREHAIFRKWEQQLEAKAAAELKLARAAAANGKHDEAALYVAKAAHYWPRADGLSTAFNSMQRRWQRLIVGVDRLSKKTSAFTLPTLADKRREFLTRTPLFEPNGVDDIVHYGTRFFQEWLPTDLGRKSLLTLYQKRPHWQAAPEVSSLIIADNLRERLNEKSPHFDERLKSYIQAIRVVSPSQLELRFSRVPPRLESVLRFPLLQLDTRLDGPAGKTLKRGEVLSSRFRPHAFDKWTADEQIFRRNIAEPDDAPESRYHVAEVIERRFETPMDAIQALKRGQIDVIAHVRPYHKDSLAEDKRLDVRQYAVPVTHVLQFHPDSVLLRHRELRRLMAYALNRREMLNRYVLRTQESKTPKQLAELGRVVSAPFASDSYAYDAEVKPKDYDIRLALALLLTLKRQHQKAHTAAVGGPMMLHVYDKGEKLGWLPTLRLLVTPGKIPRQVAEACVKQWGRIGLKVQIVEAGSAAGDDGRAWDLVYRTAKMTDPMVELWPFLTFSDRARVEALKHLPDWLRQELIRLDTARDWPRAVELVRNLHGLMAKETQVIPLFEVDDFMALRREVRAFNSLTERPVSTYENIERWRIDPRFPPAFP